MGIDQALAGAAGVDKLLGSQGPTFAFVSVAPVLSLAYFAGGYMGCASRPSPTVAGGGGGGGPQRPLIMQPRMSGESGTSITVLQPRPKTMALKARRTLFRL